MDDGYYYLNIEIGNNKFGTHFIEIGGIIVWQISNFSVENRYL